MLRIRRNLKKTQWRVETTLWSVTGPTLMGSLWRLAACYVPQLPHKNTRIRVARLSWPQQNAGRIVDTLREGRLSHGR